MGGRRNICQHVYTGNTTERIVLSLLRKDAVVKKIVIPVEVNESNL